MRSRHAQSNYVTTAAWYDESSSQVRLAANEQRSIVTERTSPVYGSPVSESLGYDPFDEDDRLAQLPTEELEDPFDAPDEESIPIPDAGDVSDEDLEGAESTIQDEVDRRRADNDPFDEEMGEVLEPELPALDPIDEPLSEDPLEEELAAETPLSDDPEDEEESLRQSEDEEWTNPDLDRVEEDLTPEQLRELSEEIERERQADEENCREDLARVEADKISSIDLSIRIEGDPGEDYPYECPVSTGTLQPREWCEITYNWKAAAICHKPPYFEQVQLERYGHSWGPFVQPIMSGAHFFGTIPILPYKMGIRTPTECVYTLGYYRPGSCAPYMIDPIPFTWRAALFETGAVTGISFVIP